MKKLSIIILALCMLVCSCARQSDLNAVVDRVDYLTEMKLQKHPFMEKGIEARAGIEY